MIIIESKESNIFKNAKKLKERKNRVKLNKYIIEGYRLIEEAFKANCNIECLIFNEIMLKEYDLYLEKYKSKVNSYVMKDNLFQALSSTESPQGVIAILNIENKLKSIDGDFYLLCDKVQDPGNLGTIIRTAHAAGINGIILTKGTVDIYNDKVIRSTMGSIFYTEIIYDDENLSLLKEMKSSGFKLIATSLEDSKNFFDEDLSQKIILTVGNEGNGVSDEVFNMCDSKVKIPMPGNAESLNVSVATSIILFERVRQNLVK